MDVVAGAPNQIVGVIVVRVRRPDTRWESVPSVASADGVVGVAVRGQVCLVFGAVPSGLFD